MTVREHDIMKECMRERVKEWAECECERARENKTARGSENKGIGRVTVREHDRMKVCARERVSECERS